MRYLFILLLVLLSNVFAQGQETKKHFESWSDFVATTARTFRTGTNRIVVSEEASVSDKYRMWTFDAEASVEGYYIIILYYTKYCTNAPAQYFNYGDNTGGDYTFHGGCDEGYCYQLLKVKTYAGKTGRVYVKNAGGNCENRSIKLYVIEF